MRGQMEFMKTKINYDDLFETYKSLFDYNHDACYALDLEGKFVLFNKAAVDITGFSKEEALQMSFYSLIQKESSKNTLYYFNSLLQGNREKFDTSIYHKSGTRVDLSITAVPIYIDEQICGVVGMAKDVTEKNTLETLLSGQNNILEMVTQGSSLQEVLDTIIYLVEKVSNGGRCSIHIVNEDGTSLIRNSSPNLPLGYSNFIKRIPVGPSAGSCGTATYRRRTIIVEDIATDPLWVDFKDEALNYGLRACWSSPVYDNFQKVLGVFAMYYDKPNTPSKEDMNILKKATYLVSLVIQHYQAEEKINFMAFHDELTGLPNKRLFDKNVRIAITRSDTDQDKNKMLGIMYLDLDRFKLINDSLGHNTGDKLLKEVAERLRTCIRTEDTISRKSGDEFTLLLINVSKQEVSKTAQKILNLLAKPFLINGHEIFITPSVGVSLYPTDDGNPDELLRKADVAMYQAKKEGRNNFQFYNKLLDKKNHERLEIENQLRKALDMNEFSLQFQPIMDLTSNEIKSVEALIRWNNPILGKVSPDRFIPITEETGLIISIGEWVLRTACLQLKSWENNGFHSLKISVNLSIRQFYQPNLISMIDNIIKEIEINPSKLTIEITESMTMDVETATSILYELKNIGVNISIDDFGTGYSSLSYLKTFPIDSLKIDQSFISDINKSKDDENIATTILVIAHNLGLSVIAEGVESKDQLEILKRHKCDEAQGYLFSKPLNSDDMLHFLRLNS
ncbi:EAL domain-containing protein [Aquibacillus halophilus]|uniref:EAL domain-containing protein n=2 Tax=Aquibacillus halophilus TaxID=930132 RepID=A0A6A8D8V1_9BACI|nr:EAL domain-containing protein [Aquibacillus halophilus]